MKNYLLLFALGLSATLFFNACSDDDDPIIPDEPELITTLNFSLTPLVGGATITLSFKDLDGDGGNDPVVTPGSLAANTTYSGTIELLNETEAPPVHITTEVQTEAEEHQFFFDSQVANLIITYDDQDANGHPVGLNSLLATGDPTSGTVTITLKHEPVKDAAGVSDGDITNAQGETDIEVTFPIDVQ
ncbi:MAG: type 1 periplasmic binding fold superfamily protein [Saprospiraceae bacterium]|nr:type 1 periplasmic binding fold superfamily protein [Saprospiraceae bacterium]